MLSRHVLLKGEYLRKLDSITAFPNAVATLMDTLAPQEGGSPVIRMGQELPSRNNHLAVTTTNDHTLFTRIAEGKEDGQILIVHNDNPQYPIYFANKDWRFTLEATAEILQFNLDLGYADTPQDWQRLEYYRDSEGVYYLDSEGVRVPIPNEAQVLNAYAEVLLPGESFIFMYNLVERCWFLVSVPFSVDGGPIA